MATVSNTPDTETNGRGTWVQRAANNVNPINNMNLSQGNNNLAVTRIINRVGSRNTKGIKIPAEVVKMANDQRQTCQDAI